MWEHQLPVLSAAVNGILVGAATVAVRYVIDQTSPASLALLRYGIGFLCLLPFVLSTRKVAIAGRDLLPVALLGIGQFGILHGLLNYALQFMPAGRAALLLATFPLQVLVLAALVGHERFTLAKTAGVLLTLVGVAATLGEKALAAGSEASWNGEMAALLAATVGAVCSVAYRPYVRRYPALPLSAWAMLASVVFLAGLAAFEGFFDAVPRFTQRGWLAVLFMGVASGIGYGLWLWGLSRTSATRITVFLALSPVTAAALAAWLLDERISGGFSIGVTAVALGLWLAYRPERVSGRADA